MRPVRIVRGRGHWGGPELLTERTGLTRVATTTATEAEIATAAEDAAATANDGSRRTTGLTNVGRTRTPVGRDGSAAQAAAEATSRETASEAGTAGTDANGAVVNG